MNSKSTGKNNHLSHAKYKSVKDINDRHKEDKLKEIEKLDLGQTSLFSIAVVDLENKVNQIIDRLNILSKKGEQ